MTEDIAKKYKCGFLDCTFACKYRQQMQRHRKLKEHFIESVRKVICDDDDEDGKFLCAIRSFQQKLMLTDILRLVKLKRRKYLNVIFAIKYVHLNPS